jgi:tripartite ATP-independent transporter DctP family solute receptor
VLPGFDDRFFVLDLPYLFISAQAARNALDGELGALLNKYLADKGIVNLYWGESGFRNMTNNKRPIYSPADMQGMKLRTMENVYHMSAFSSWGSNPTPMAFGELFTALQQGTVDGQDNATVIVSTSKLNEVQKYLSITEHIYGGNCTFINKKLYDSMPAEYQNILMEAAKKTAVVHRQLIDELNQKLVGELKAKGMQINNLTADQKKAFAEAAARVQQDFVAKFGPDLVNLAKKYNQ